MTSDRRLQRSALARVVWLVVNPVCRGDQPIAASGRVPRQADAGSESLLKGWNQAVRDALVSRIEQSRRRVGEHGGLPPRNPECLPVLDFGVWERQVVTQAEVQSQTPRGFESVLHVAVERLAVDPAAKIAPAIKRRVRAFEIGWRDQE